MVEAGSQNVAAAVAAVSRRLRRPSIMDCSRISRSRSRRCFKETEAASGLFQAMSEPESRSRRCFKETEAAADHLREECPDRAAVAAVSRRLRRGLLLSAKNLAAQAAVAAVSRRLRRWRGRL